MKMKNKCAAGRLEKSGLLAAMAILAVAFVVLAAVPAALTDSDAEESVKSEVSTLKELETSIAANENTTLVKDADVTIEKGNSVSIPAGKTLTVNGTLTVNVAYGLTIAGGTVNGSGTIDGTAAHPVYMTGGEISGVTVVATNANGRDFRPACWYPGSGLKK